MRPLALLALFLLAPLPARALTPQERGASVQYVRSLQNRDGGFRPAAAPGPSSVAATTACLRALKYLGGRPDTRGIPFLNRCMLESGAIADRPGETPTPRSTALGLMALVELQVALKFGLGEQIADWLSANAKELPDIYLAVAALDAAKLKTARARAWIAQFEATRNPDGSYGKGPADTAGALLTSLRLGARPRDPNAARRSLLAAQRPDGGWSGDGTISDLPTTYRVMRALWMLQARPDLARLRRFVASCRNPDGGYGMVPGQPSGASGTYQAAIVLHWADELER